MRILIVTPEYPPHAGGGLLKFYRLLAPALTQAGASVTILVATPYSEFADYDHDGVAVRFIPLNAVSREAGGLPHLASAPLVRKWIAAGRAAAAWIKSQPDGFDIVETTDFGLLFAPLVSERSESDEERLPVVVQMHGSIGQIMDREPAIPSQALDHALCKLLEGTLLPLADAVQAYSPANAAEWTRRLHRDVDVLPPAFPLPSMSPEGVPGAPVLVVGRVQPWKGAALLCRALQRPGADIQHLTVDWVGRDTPTAPTGTSYSKYLTAEFPDTWGSRVRPIGERAAAEVAARQVGARVVLVPSEWDTFNFTLVEAMSLGCVVVASSGAGASYLVDHGHNGFTFDPGDPDSLASALATAMALTDAERLRVSSGARDTIRAKLNPERAAFEKLDSFRRAQSAPHRQVPAALREFLDAPDATINVDNDAFLENVSIRALTRHLGARVGRRIRM